MKNPLRSIDELISDQFAKITTKAERSLGWDKYELMKKTANLGSLSVMSLGLMFLTDLFQHTYQKGSITLLEVFGDSMIIGFTGVNAYHCWKGNKEESEEIKTAETYGDTPQPITEPVINATRPLQIAAASIPIAGGIAIAAYQSLEYQTQLIEQIKNDTWAITGLTLFSTWPLFNICSNYFKSQKTPYIKNQPQLTSQTPTSSHASPTYDA